MFFHDYNWIKFQPSVTGYITITAKNASAVYNTTAGYITFCDSSKKALGQINEIYRTDYDKAYYYTVTYGVRKGQTYYFRVNSQAGVSFDAVVKAQKKNAGAKKAKAKTLKQNKAVNGVIIAGEKTVDWYKIKLNKSQQIKLTYSAKSNGDDDYNGIKVTFCKSNGKKFLYNSYDHVNRVVPSSWTKYFMKNDRTGKKSGLKPGTYYVKVERYNATSSGFYTLKWK